MDDQDIHHFYAGMALVGLLSHRGVFDDSTARSAHQMAIWMTQEYKKLVQDYLKTEDNNGK